MPRPVTPRSPNGAAGLFPTPASPALSSPPRLELEQVQTPQRLSPASPASPVPPTSPISMSHPSRSDSIVSLNAAFLTPPRSLPLTPRRSISETTIQRVDISPSEKRRADKFFDMLDPWGRGQIESDVIVPFFQKSKLPAEVLAHVWYVFISQT